MSFDAKSLFTMLDRNLIIDILKKKFKKIQDTIGKHLSWSMFEKLISFCISDSTYFSALDKKYYQKQGCPMGSSISPILADIVLTELLDFATKTVFEKFNYKPKLITKYVDDLLFIIRASFVDIFLNIMNDFNPLLKFTFELPVNNSIPYLDMLIIKKDNKIITNWYQKETSKGRMLNFNSCHSISIKMNTAKGFLNRIFGLSHQSFWDNNIQIATNILRKNEYPIAVINRLINNEINKILSNQTLQDNINNSLYVSCIDESQSSTLINIESPRYYSFTYIKNLSEELRRIIKTNIPDIKITFKYRNTIGLRLFSKIKDKTPKNETSGVIYQVNCKDCNAIYVGQTGNKIRTRMYGHKHDVTDTSRIGCKLAEHSKTTKHSFDFENVSILDTEKQKFKREILEMIYIKKSFKNGNCINCKNDVDNLSKIYVGIM